MNGSWDDFQNHFRYRNPNTIDFGMYSYSILVGAWWPSWSHLGTESGHFSIYPTEFKCTIGFYIIPCNLWNREVYGEVLLLTLRLCFVCATIIGTVGTVAEINNAAKHKTSLSLRTTSYLMGLWRIE